MEYIPQYDTHSTMITTQNAFLIPYLIINKNNIIKYNRIF